MRAVAYRLQLPKGARIHDVFHVGVLKPLYGTPPTVPPPLPLMQHGRALQEPTRAVRAQLQRGAWYVLVQRGVGRRVPCGSPLLLARGWAILQHVMVGQTYQRRNRSCG